MGTTVWKTSDQGIELDQPFIPAGLGGVSSVVAINHIAANEVFIYMDASGGSRTVTLPNPSAIVTGRFYVIQKTDTSSNAVVITATATTINGAATYSFAGGGDTVTVQYNGTEWRVLDGLSTRTLYFGGDYGGNFNDYRSRSVGSGGTQRFTWAVPDDFKTLVSVELVGAIAGVGNVAGTYTLDSDYGAVGEQNDNHSETDATGVSDFSAAGEIKAIDISSVYSVLAAGDSCGLSMQHTGIGTTMNYFFVKLVYTRT